MKKRKGKTDQHWAWIWLVLVFQENQFKDLKDIGRTFLFWIFQDTARSRWDLMLMILPCWKCEENLLLMLFMLRILLSLAARKRDVNNFEKTLLLVDYSHLLKSHGAKWKTIYPILSLSKRKSLNPNHVLKHTAKIQLFSSPFLNKGRFPILMFFTVFDPHLFDCCFLFFHNQHLQ